MPVKLPPPPHSNTVLDRWLNLLWRKFSAAGELAWSLIDKTGSNLTDIETRNHNDLQNLNAGDYVHLTAANHTDLTDGGDSALHFHATDRARANHTGTQDGTTVVLERIGASTYSHVQHLQNIFHSAGYVEGAAVTSNGDGTCAVAAGNGTIRSADSEVSTVSWFDFAAVASVSLTDNSLNWVYVYYNSGSPVVTSSTTEPPNHHEYVKLASVYRTGTTLHINQTIRFNVGDHAANMVQRTQETTAFARASGAALTESGTRNLNITAGAFWNGLNRFTTAALDTSVSGSFSTFYRDGAGGWTKTSGVTQVDNTQYDDGSGTLQNILPNQYSARWIYLATDGDVSMLYGQSSSVSLATIQATSPPSSIPPELRNDSFLLARIIVREGTAAFIQIDDAFATRFSSTGTPNHNDLGGLQGGTSGQYYHLTSTEYTGTGSGTFVRQVSPTITGHAVVDANSSSAALRITQVGSGDALLVEDNTNPDSTPFVIDTVGRIISGFTSATSTRTNVTAITPSFQVHSAASASEFGAFSWFNGATPAALVFSKSRSSTRGTVGTAVQSGDQLGRFSATGDDGTQFTEAARLQFVCDGTPGTDSMPGRIEAYTTPSGSNTTIIRWILDSNGVTGYRYKFGYGTISGAGGQMTQATSKSTAVTLNKPSGQITMNSANLAAGATVLFTLTNSEIEANDNLICHRKSGGTAGAYMVWVDSVASGSAVIAVKNDTGGDLAESPVLQFAVIKGAIA